MDQRRMDELLLAAQISARRKVERFVQLYYGDRFDGNISGTDQVKPKNGGAEDTEPAPDWEAQVDI